MGACVSSCTGTPFINVSPAMQPYPAQKPTYLWLKSATKSLWYGSRSLIIRASRFFTSDLLLVRFARRLVTDGSASKPSPRKEAVSAYLLDAERAGIDRGWAQRQRSESATIFGLGLYARLFMLHELVARLIHYHW